MKITAEIIKRSPAWRKHKDINSRSVKNIIKHTISLMPNFSEITEVEIAILLTDNEEMQELNTNYRGKNKPTNVLSFPFVTIDPNNALEFKPSRHYNYLGDLAFGYEVIELESKSIGFYEHFTHLLVHGLLHLIGFDHEAGEKNARDMENLEVKILNHFSINSPY
ncbi:MAG: rRNA maturation RNase YbeY [Rickettsiaceae bacterium]|nr:rRNA maturation RNase YbeY [Rickettsiaceae bacterium]